MFLFFYYIILEILKDYFYEPMYHFYIVPYDLIGWHVKHIHTLKHESQMVLFVCMQFNGPVNTIKLMSSWSVNLLTLSLAGLDLLSN